uniref:Putative ovule protein n=1 Tax=Solanum chacoense TaxID=4108 RepID=A0A0V0HZW0_SOLCH
MPNVQLQALLVDMYVCACTNTLSIFKCTIESQDIFGISPTSLVNKLYLPTPLFNQFLGQVLHSYNACTYEFTAFFYLLHYALHLRICSNHHSMGFTYDSPSISRQLQVFKMPLKPPTKIGREA